MAETSYQNFDLRGVYTQRVRPAQGGDSISHYHAGAATLGCLVQDRADPRRVYILCDYSGLCVGADSRTGDPVLQPGRVDSGNPASDIIATISRWAAVRMSTLAAADNVSAVLAQVDDLTTVSPEIRGRGFLRGVRPANPATKVYAVGRTSGQMRGTVVRVDAHTTVAWPRDQVVGPVPGTGDAYGNVAIPFDGLIECTPMLLSGDSGAILVDGDNYALGLGFAGSDAASLFLPMQRVLDALSVNLVTEEVWRSLTQPAASPPPAPSSGRSPTEPAPAPGSGRSPTGPSPAPSSSRSPTGPALAPSAYVRELTAIAEKLQQGRLTLFIGADLPESAAGLPGRQVLADGLAARFGLAAGQRLATVAQQVMSAGQRFEFTDFIRNALDLTGKAPAVFHQGLARLIQRYRLETIFTVAYDAMLETALREAGVAADVVVRESQISFVRGDRPTLYKLYGDCDQMDTLVVTEQDQNALLRGRIKAELVDELRRAFRRSSLLFLGYDLADPVVAALFDEVAGGNFQAPAFAAWSGLPEPQRTSFKSNRNLTVLDLEPVALIEALLS